MLSKEFIMGGRALFTVSSPRGGRYTYKIDHNEKIDKWFVSLLTGPDNTQDYTYMGMFNPVSGNVRLTNKSGQGRIRFNDETESYKVIKWALYMIYNEKQLPEGYKIHHEGRCARCSRVLTVPESIESGFGPECIKHVFLVDV